MTWTSSGGSITATGRFTAPSQPGSVTITARSKEDTTKTGATTVTVQAPGVTVTGRNSQVDFVTARAIATSSNINCPRGDTHVDNHLLSARSRPARSASGTPGTSTRWRWHRRWVCSGQPRRRDRGGLDADDPRRAVRRRRPRRDLHRDRPPLADHEPHRHADRQLRIDGGPQPAGGQVRRRQRHGPALVLDDAERRPARPAAGGGRGSGLRARHQQCRDRRRRWRPSRTRPRRRSSRCLRVPTGSWSRTRPRGAGAIRRPTWSSASAPPPSATASPELSGLAPWSGGRACERIAVVSRLARPLACLVAASRSQPWRARSWPAPSRSRAARTSRSASPMPWPSRWGSARRPASGSCWCCAGPACEWRGSSSAARCRWRSSWPASAWAASRSTTIRLDRGRLGARRRDGVDGAVPVAARARLRLSRRPAAVAPLAADGRGRRGVRRRHAGAAAAAADARGAGRAGRQPDRRRARRSRTC